MKTIADLFYESVRTYPEKTAIWCESKSITYQELANLVSQYSHFLISNGVAYRDHIGIPMNNSITSVALILAAANLGVGLVPINPTMPISSIRKAFAVADVKHIIARRAFFEQCDKNGGIDVEGSRICIDHQYQGTVSLLNSEEMSVERPVIKEVDGEEILIITMTSGSTGNPKPISLTQKNKYLRAFAHIDLYKITRDDKILAATPLYHSLAERLVLIPLLIGGTSVLLPRFTPNLWLDCVKEQGVTFTIAVSAQLNQIASYLSNPIELGINTLRSVVSSSALLDTKIKNELIEKLHCDFHEMYGTSEVSTVTSINFREAIHKKQSVGRTLPEADVVIFRDNGELAPTGEVGEIACMTSLICDGYYGMNETFRNSMQNGYFKTGDLGFLDEEGYLYFSGRKKELIITGGTNVYPIDIEKCVMEISAVSECAAFAFPDDRLGEIVALAIVIKEGSELNKRTVQMHAARNLADYQQPHKIFFLDELPKNAMGKLVKSKITDYIEFNNEGNG
ncbi:class I adenylate-forming enzyme family protein [Metabacillus sp. B2-18]|uniref:class I adenylate-forming enzyme family protein n=1 Tax=Metabacillus sp. B2-18 TaxID=2897333 RepID=UPI001E2DE2A9|nr:class I adenylate-forming enzyme family protein [Metabacillus sp. B2-18]UGB30418.1 acyl--CoA ligase [Metabacillus sp. B2-18]